METDEKNIHVRIKMKYYKRTMNEVMYYVPSIQLKKISGYGIGLLLPHGLLHAKLTLI